MLVDIFSRMFNSYFPLCLSITHDRQLPIEILTNARRGTSIVKCSLNARLATYVRGQLYTDIQTSKRTLELLANVFVLAPQGLSPLRDLFMGESHGIICKLGVDC